MRLHQILTGSCNATARAFSRGVADGATFIAYASGCDLVILDGGFKRVQILPGVTHGQVQISGLDCSQETGKIAASYGDHIVIFEPIPVAQEDAYFPFKWKRFGEICADSPVTDLAWSPNGDHLITAGESIQIWVSSPAFTIVLDDCPEEAEQPAGGPAKWRCAWTQKLSKPVDHVRFSSDGLFFASYGKNDPFLKIWYRDNPPGFASESDQIGSGDDRPPSFNFVYLSHPAPVTGFSWRQTSQQMPRGCVANLLITSCEDNVCRIWSETVLPDDGLIDASASATAAAAANSGSVGGVEDGAGGLSDLAASAAGQPSSWLRRAGGLSMGWPHEFAGTRQDSLGAGNNSGRSPLPSVRFNLVASVNPETDIPLMPSFGRHLRGGGGGSGNGFVMHWLNNKYLQFTKRSSRQQQQQQDSTTQADAEDPALKSAKPTSLDAALDRWYQCPDMLFAIHPYDGSFLVWMVEWIDERSSGCYRQAHVSFSSSIPRAFPVGDAISMSSHLILYGEDADVWGGVPAARQQQLQQQLGESLSTSVGNLWKSGGGGVGGGAGGKSRGGGLILPCAMILSKHRNGSLNLWQINFAENSSYQTVVSISHVDRMSGHRFRTNNVQCHPVLPLVVTSSQHELQQQQQEAADSQTGSDFNSELILWRVESVGPLSSSGGMTELARVNSALPTAFTHMAWLPVLLPTSVLGPSNRSPGTVFVAFDGVRLRCYMAVIDARSILTARAGRHRQQAGAGASGGLSSSTTDTSIASHVSMAGSGNSSGSEIVSLQSASKPGCVVELAEVADSCVPGGGRALVLHAFAEPLVAGNRSASSSTDAQTGNFYLAMLVAESEGGRTRLHVWRITLGKRPFTEQQQQHAAGSGSPSEPESPHADSSRRTLLSELSLTVASAKVASAALALPPGVGVTQAAVSAGHLSSASIYPACLSPYLLATVCTDNRIRFWSPWQQAGGSTIGSDWREWLMLGDSPSAIDVPGQPLCVSCAYSGRIAVAYRSSTAGGGEYDDDDGARGLASGSGRLFDIRVAIYEWESTGGTCWTLEDSIHLHKSILASSLKNAPQSNGSEPDWPSERFVQLDWVSTEDGSHILSVAASTCIQMFAPVSHDLATATAKDYHDMKAALKRQGRAVLQQRTKMAGESAAGLEIRWMRLRAIQLSTADDLAPLPMRVAWVREGLLVVGMDNELHVYSQWKPLLGGLGAAIDDAKESSSKATPAATAGAGVNKTRTGYVDKRELTDLALSKSAANLPLNRLHSTYSAYSLTEHEHQAATLSATAQPAQPQHLDLAAFIQDVGLFEAAQICNPTLPQYHPKKLMELLGFGKFKRIRAILAHLTHCVVEGAQPQAVGDEAVLDIKAIPPLPLYALLEADSDSGAGAGAGSQSGAGVDASTGLLNGDSGGGANDLLLDNTFADDEAALPDTYSHNLLDDDDDDDEEGKERVDGSPKSRSRLRLTSTSGRRQQVANRMAFGPDTAKLLTEHLMQIQLPGLSRLDQMYLLALAEVVANLQTGLGADWQPKPTAGGARLASLDDGSVRGYTSTEGSVRGLTDSLDACGLRFFVVLQHHTYLLRTLPPSQRAELAQNGIAAGNLVWAFHSEAQEELLSRLPVTESGDLSWSVMKQYGCGWWVRNDSLLRRCAERAAKAAFQTRQEPLDAAAFYLAMRRVKVMAALYKTVSNQKLQEFFRQDFSQERWRTAALKNAFDLLGKQRFEHAAAFFLLGNSVKDAVEVCVTKLHDLQLAIVLARLHAAEGVLVADSNQPLTDLLNKHVLSPSGRYYSNPFYRSMAHWLLKDYDQAVSTLLLGEPDSALLDQSSPSVFNYFNYLKCHPLILRQAKLRGGLPVGMGAGGASTALTTAAASSTSSSERMSLTERRLFFRTAHAYFRLGCPSLALEVLTRLPDYLRVEAPASDSQGDAQPQQQQQAEQPPPAAKEEADNFLCWNDIGTAADADDERPPSLRLSSSSSESGDNDPEAHDLENNGDEALTPVPGAGEAVSNTPTGNGESPAVLDVMTHQLRFVACQRIMSEELSTLATGFEVDGGQLRAQLYAWLERETALLKRLCHYGCGPGEDDDDQDAAAAAAAAPADGLRSGRKASLVDLGSTASGRLNSFHSRLDSWQRRKLWLRDNEQLLRTLLSFCSLHGASGGGLTSVRMELVLLLQELLQDSLTDAPLQLEAKMPLPNSLPLINAAVSNFKTVVADPIRQLQNLIGDVLGQLRRWAAPPELPANAQELFLLRSISAAVSACVYQCLVDTVRPPSDAAAAAAGFTTSLVYGDYYCLMSRLSGQRSDASSHNLQQQQLGALRDAALYAYGSSPQQEEADAPNTQPSKWPGIAHLRSLLERHKDDDVPRLNIILTEAFLSVYLATLAYGLTTANAKILHRLVARQLNASVWGVVFGGGLKTPQRPAPMRLGGSAAGANQSSSSSTTSGVIIAGGGSGASPRRQAQQQMLAASGGIPRVTDEMSKQRVRLYLTTVQGGGAPPLPPPPAPQSQQQLQQPSPTTTPSSVSRGFTERFVQPRASILGCLLAKLPPDPRQPAGQAADFDSANVSDDEDADADGQDDEHADAAPDEIPGFGGSMAELEPDRSYRSGRQLRQQPSAGVSRRRQAALERREYAWLLMRCACVRVALDQVGRFLPQVGLELSDLPVESPALYNAVKRVHQWQRAFRNRLRRIGQPPDGFLGGDASFNVDPTTVQPGRLLMERYKLLLDAGRTPFPGRSLSDRLCNRLWALLLRKEPARDIFAKFAFPPPPQQQQQQQQQQKPPPRPPPPPMSSAELTESAPPAAADLPVALVHDTKGEAISSFCLSRANQNCLTLATSKELVELDIGDLMLHPFSPAGLDDEDYAGPATSSVAGGSGGGGLVSDAVNQLDTDQLPRLLTSFAVPGVTPVPTLSSSVIKGWPARLITRRSLPKPRQVAAHPDRHNYLFGSASGAIDCYEWSHRAPLTKPGSVSVGGRVTALRFNAYGNRFAVGDSEGYVSLWHWRSIVGAGGGGGAGAEPDRPYRMWRGHSRGCADLLFAGCSTLYATGGAGAESEANTALWDTLLPVEKSVVQRFFDPALQAGCTSLAYAPQRQLLLAGTAKGGVALLDLRKAAVRHAFQAHEPGSAVTTLCVDPSERLLLTGSADGSVRAWRLGAHEPLACFRDEHVAPRSLLRSASDQGVQRLELCTRDGHCYLFSCGCDGTVKLRPMDSLISA